MAASDQVGSVPGAQELATLAAQVKGDPGAITTIAGVWTNAASDAASQTQAIGDAINTVQGEWTGNGSEAFVSLMDQFGAVSRRVEGSLKAAAAQLKAAAKTLQGVQNDVEGICQDLLNEVSTLQSAKKKLTNLQQLIEAAAAKATGKAKAKIQQAEQELQQVISELNTALSAAENEYSALPVPSGGSFNPSVSTTGTVLPTVPTTNGSGSPIALAGNGSPSGGAPLAGSGSTGGSGPLTGGSGGSGGGIAGVTSGSGFENELTVAKFLVAHGYSKAAAAGIASCIAGESAGSPEAVGSGGWGLIGWTPQTPGEYQNLYPTGNASADLGKQMAAILTYNNANGNVAALNAIHDPVQAADYYSQTFERPLVTDSDVRANVATAIFQALGS